MLRFTTAAIWLLAIACTQDDDPVESVTLQAETATQTNIPTKSHPDAAGGTYLVLDTTQDPPASGWFATYRVRASRAGIYRLSAVVSPPALPDREEHGGSHFQISVNGAPFASVEKSQPSWWLAPDVWDPGDGMSALVRATLDDVELKRGVNEITFKVDERRTAVNPVAYLFSLDEFALAPVALGVAAAYAGDPATNLGIARAGEPVDLGFRLNGRARSDGTITYQISNYFSKQVAAGTAAIRAGDRTTKTAITGLAPGHYRVTARLASSPAIEGTFAVLPAESPVRGRASRFAGTVSSPWLVPPSRRAAFAAALHDAGASYVRDEIFWPAVEEAPEIYDTSALDRAAQDYRAAGVKTLGALWFLGGNMRAPDWAMTEASAPLPADLRDAYRFLNHLAGRSDGIGASALELWNEPDADVEADPAGSSDETPDTHAAYLKAAALGVADRATRPLISLSGIAFGNEPEGYHEVILQSGVARYADIWAFHGYGVEGILESAVHIERRRLHGATGLQLWMTETGAFVPGEPFTFDKQVELARRLVQSSVTQLAGGADKLFWFAASPYQAGDDAGSFGWFGAAFEPWPSYSAHAAMAALLGEANFARAVPGLPAGAHAYVFKSGARAITVAWADAPTAVTLPVIGTRADLHDIMGARTNSPPIAGDTISITAGLDPIYIVSDGGGSLTARPTANDEQRAVQALSAAEHVVLSQRFAESNATPERPQVGYRLNATTSMHLDVYNFNAAPKTVTVAPRIWGGWSLRTQQPQTVTVPAMGRASIPYVVKAGGTVAMKVDYPLVFEAAIGQQAVPPSVGRIYLDGKKPGEPIALAPAIGAISPADGSTVHGSQIQLAATITDALSGVNPQRVTIEVDGAPVQSQFVAATGRLSATLQLPPGNHEIAIRAYNHAHAPARVSITLIVE